MTKRVEEALRNPSVRCLSHPKGRYINRRPENALDLERIFQVALEEGVALEVNGLPDRLDLRGEHVRDALAAGLQIACSTDAHSVRGLGNMTLSVATARRGWATSWPWALCTSVQTGSRTGWRCAAETSTQTRSPSRSGSLFSV